MAWCYEREFRLTASPFVDGPLRLDGNFVTLPEGALTAIIVGCGNADFEEVREIVEEHAPGLPIKLNEPRSYPTIRADDPGCRAGVRQHRQSSPGNRGNLGRFGNLESASCGGH
jgi:hypothetical protein